MPNSGSIFILGGTGNQGGAVAKRLLVKNFTVKILTRNPDSPKAKHLKELGAEIISGDLDNSHTFNKYLKDVKGIFCVLAFDDGVDKEINRGINLVNLVKENNIELFLYSSFAGAYKKTGVPHWDSKYKIESYIKNIGIPYAIIRPSLLYETFLFPRVKDGILKGKLISPVNKFKNQQFISCEDIGKISTDIFINPGKYLDKTITLGTEQYNLLELADLFSKVLGKQIKYQKLPMIITRIAMGNDLYKMFKWINQNNADFMNDVENFKLKHPDYLRFENWIEANFKNI